MKKLPFKIAIIGGGLSGLTIAFRLQQQGIHAEVYEARKRLGGRVFSININGHTSELGAQNILDGGKAKNILALAKELGLEIIEKKSPVRFSYFERGAFFDVDSLIKETAFCSVKLKNELEILAGKSQNMKEVLDALFRENTLLYKACTIMLSGYEGGPVETLSPFYAETLFHRLMGGLSSAHQGEAEGNLSYIYHKSIKGGNARLIERLENKLKGSINLDHALHTLTKKNDGSYQLFFKNGRHIDCDLVVLTLPCPTFKNISFSPNVLPESTISNIRGVKYGTNAKIIVPVTSPRFNQGAFSNGRIVTFDNFDGSAINMYYTNEFGNFNSQTVHAKFLEDLPFVRKIYPLATEKNAVAAKEKQFCDYDEPVGHSWLTDPFSLGSYSYIGAGQEDICTATHKIGNETVKSLFSPVDNSLFFAGEHTSVLLDVGGTMEAAVESGERTARLISMLQYQNLR